MNKSYNIKVYDKTGTYITTVRETERLSKISFRSNINGGQGELSLEVKSSFDSPPSWAAFNNFVKVYVVKIVAGVQTEQLLFCGFISQFTNTKIGSNESMTVTILSLSSLLGLALYKDGASFDVVHTAADPSDIAIDIISKVNTQIGGSWLSTSSNVDTVGTDVSYTFAHKKWSDSMDKCVELSGGDFFWYIGADGDLHFKSKSATPDHKFNILKNVNEIEVTNSSESIVNESTIDSVSSTESATDATSISTYWKRDEWKSDSDMDSTAGQQYVDGRVADKKEPLFQVKVVINETYDIESIHPGHTCKFFGTKIGSTTLGGNMLIVAVSYKENYVALTLEDDSVNFGVQLSRFMSQ